MQTPRLFMAVDSHYENSKISLNRMKMNVEQTNAEKNEE